MTNDNIASNVANIVWWATAVNWQTALAFLDQEPEAAYVADDFENISTITLEEFVEAWSDSKERIEAWIFKAQAIEDYILVDNFLAWAGAKRDFGSKDVEKVRLKMIKDGWWSSKPRLPTKEEFLDVWEECLSVLDERLA